MSGIISGIRHARNALRGFDPGYPRFASPPLTFSFEPKPHRRPHHSFGQHDLVPRRTRYRRKARFESPPGQRAAKTLLALLGSPAASPAAAVPLIRLRRSIGLVAMLLILSFGSITLSSDGHPPGKPKIRNQAVSHVWLPPALSAKLPPSTASSVPVTIAAASEARKIAGPAMSSASASRFMGIPARKRSMSA